MYNLINNRITATNEIFKKDKKKKERTRRRDEERLSAAAMAAVLQEASHQNFVKTNFVDIKTF